MREYPFTETFRNEDDEESFADAYYSRWYVGVVASLVERIKEDSEAGDDLPDKIHEAVAGSQYIIYTSYHALILRQSKNDDAYMRAFGNEGLTEHSEYMQAAAFFALREDVTEELGDWQPEETEVEGEVAS